MLKSVSGVKHMRWCQAQSLRLYDWLNDTARRWDIWAIQALITCQIWRCLIGQFACTRLAHSDRHQWWMVWQNLSCHKGPDANWSQPLGTRVGGQWQNIVWLYINVSIRFLGKPEIDTKVHVVRLFFQNIRLCINELGKKWRNINNICLFANSASFESNCYYLKCIETDMRD